MNIESHQKRIITVSINCFCQLPNSVSDSYLSLSSPKESQTKSNYRYEHSIFFYGCFTFNKNRKGFHADADALDDILMPSTLNGCPHRK